MPRKTPSPPPEAPSGMSHRHPADEAVGHARQAVPRVLRALPMPALNPGGMAEDMKAFLRVDAEAHGDVHPFFQAVLRRDYAGFGRAFNRYRAIAEGNLTQDMTDMLGYVRREIKADEVTQPHVAYLAQIEDPLFALARGIHTDGLSSVMDERGKPTAALTQGLEEVLQPMTEGCDDLRQFFKRNSITEGRLFEALADAITHYFNHKEEGETNDELIVPIQRLLAQIGFDNEATLKILIKNTDQPMTELSPGSYLINPEVYARVEQLMALAIDRHLDAMSSDFLKKRPATAKNIAREILAFLKFTQLNRWRVMKPYWPLVAPMAGQGKRRLIDKVDSPFQATSELLRILHLAMHLMRSEAHQKNYLLPR